MNAVFAMLVVVQHFVFDWICQSRWIAVNKSKDKLALLVHGFIVACGFGSVAVLMYPLELAGIVSLAYGMLHMTQDKIIWSTFKPATDNPYEEKQFWNTVAIDQIIHLLVAILLLSLF